MIKINLGLAGRMDNIPNLKYVDLEIEHIEKMWHQYIVVNSANAKIYKIETPWGSVKFYEDT